VTNQPNIVLVHGAWADGSCWGGVIRQLQADGYRVTAPQFPMTALADDVARLRQVLNLQDGPTIVAGHSYGGQIMTALGADAPNAAGLVYVAGLRPRPGRVDRRPAVGRPGDPCAGAHDHRQAGVRLAERG
jgi:pimeloyl-ACP methyl ester carboxylesterase